MATDNPEEAQAGVSGVFQAAPRYEGPESATDGIQGAKAPEEVNRLSPWRRIVAASDRVLMVVSLTSSVICGVALALIVGLVLIHVVVRTLFNRALWDPAQLGAVAVPVIAFTGVAWSYREGVQPSVSVLIDRLPKRVAIPVQLVTLSLSVVVLIMVIRETIGYAAYALRHNELIAGGHEIPAFIPEFLIPIGLVAVCLEIVRGIIMDLRGFVLGAPVSRGQAPGGELDI